MNTDSQKDRVKLQFGRAASEYATSDVHACGESLDVLLELVSPISTWQMLDVATGAGHTALAFAPLVAKVVATDLTQEMLSKSTELATEKGLSNFESYEADAEALPFNNHQFDFLTCRLAFHHFPNPETALSEFARVLKPGASLGFTDNITIDDPEAAKFYNHFETIRDPSHHCVYSMPKLESMFRTAGFKVRESKTLTKEFEFEPWADRQRVSNSDKNTLLEMLESVPAELRPWMRPRRQSGKAYFTLWETVIMASRV